MQETKKARLKRNLKLVGCWEIRDDWQGAAPASKVAAMDGRDVWKIADHLNVYEISLLLGGYDPSEFVEFGAINWSNTVNLRTYSYLTAIQNAVATDRIRSEKRTKETAYGTDIDWTWTLIEVASLSEWLIKKNATGLFFTADAPQTLGFADNTNPFYAPKLAAAVDAWTVVTSNMELHKNKTPKQALDKWLREHAIEYGLTLETGDPNKQGIAEICKIANWKPEGGVSPTYATAMPEISASNVLKAEGRQLRPKPPTRSTKPARRLPAIDDDIPF